LFDLGFFMIGNDVVDRDNGFTIIHSLFPSPGISFEEGFPGFDTFT